MIKFQRQNAREIKEASKILNVTLKILERKTRRGPGGGGRGGEGTVDYKGSNVSNKRR